jgi:hypothetical protein
MYEAGLEEGMIFSDHPAAGNWESLQGTHCATWETPTLESHAMGDSRHQTTTKSPEWDSTIIVHTGVTRGGPDGKYHSDLPNH